MQDLKASASPGSDVWVGLSKCLEGQCGSFSPTRRCALIENVFLGSGWIMRKCSHVTQFPTVFARPAQNLSALDHVRGVIVEPAL